jgi:type I restriction enzyme S subunit
MRASYPTYKSTSIPWPDSIPESWELVKISSVFRERRETVSDKDFAPLSVTMQGIVPQLETAAKTDNGDNRKKVCAGDFVINSRSDRKGSAGISHLDGSVSVISIVLKPLKRLNERYVNYLLTNYYFQEEFYRYGKGIVADLWSTKYSSMKGMFIPLPSLEEQTAIANYLDAKTEQINRFIAKKEKLIALLKEQKQAVINELLEDKEGKWERRKLKYVVSMKSGNFIDAVDIHETGDFPVFGGNGLRGFAKNYTHEGDYVLIGRQGALCGNVNFAYGKFWPSEHAIVCTPKVMFDTFWFGNAVRSLNLGQYSQSAAQPGISIGVVSNVSLPFPDYTTQQQISERIKNEGGRIDETIIRIEKEIEKVKELKQSLIAEVVTGRIKVA